MDPNSAGWTTTACRASHLLSQNSLRAFRARPHVRMSRACRAAKQRGEVNLSKCFAQRCAWQTTSICRARAHIVACLSRRRSKAFWQQCYSVQTTQNGCSCSLKMALLQQCLPLSVCPVAGFKKTHEFASECDCDCNAILLVVSLQVLLLMSSN